MSFMTALDRRYDTKIHRRVTRTVMVGDVPIGSEHPVVVQSMINEDTLDIDAVRRRDPSACGSWL
jgi:(E)-4-hydroxy-3-methylbut-2-enyl-diphosphate synthase